MNVSRAFKIGAFVVLCSTAALAASAEQSQSFLVDFPHVKLKAGQSFSTVRVVAICGRVSAINFIPDDWYVSTVRTQGSLDPKSPEFIYSAVAVEFSAGHGASRMTDLSKFSGAFSVVEESHSCFKVVATVSDDIADGGPNLTLGPADLRLRR